MRTVNKGGRPNDTLRLYNVVLSNRIGRYCSYCECYLPETLPLTLEHKVPYNGNNDPRMTDWFNLVLTCTSCNSVKSHRARQRDFYLWPDIPWHNTGVYLVVNTNGSYSVSCHTPPALLAAAENSIWMLKLDDELGIGNDTGSLRGRVNAANYCESWFRKYINDGREPIEKNEDHFNDLVTRGYLSIWISILRNRYPQLEYLINQVVIRFPSTYSIGGVIF